MASIEIGSLTSSVDLRPVAFNSPTDAPLNEDDMQPRPEAACDAFSLYYYYQKLALVIARRVRESFEESNSDQGMAALTDFRTVVGKQGMVGLQSAIATNPLKQASAQITENFARLSDQYMRDFSASDATPREFLRLAQINGHDLMTPATIICGRYDISISHQTAIDHQMMIRTLGQFIEMCEQRLAACETPLVAEPVSAASLVDMLAKQINNHLANRGDLDCITTLLPTLEITVEQNAIGESVSTAIVLFPMILLVALGENISTNLYSVHRDARRVVGRVEVKAEAAETGVVLRIEDDGPGFPQQLVLAGRFLHGVGVNTDGSHIGMATLTGLFVEQGGDITIENRLNPSGEVIGARQSIWLPTITDIPHA